MKEVKVTIEPNKKEIEILMPLELRKKIREEELDEINSKLFDIATMLNNIAKRQSQFLKIVNN